MSRARAALLAIAAGVAFFYLRGYRVIFKNGVVLTLAPEMARALPGIEKAHELAKVGRGAVVTSGSEPETQHMKGSLHYVGRAIDIRSHDLTSAQVTTLRDELRAQLNGSKGVDRPYQVIIETAPAHIHIEYDPR